MLEHATPELVPLLRRLHDVLASRPVDPAAARATITALLEFLCSPIGRTDANCCGHVSAARRLLAQR